MKKTVFLLCFLCVVLYSGAEKSSTNMKVIIETSLGNIEVKLYDATPLHRDNFLKLIKESYYNGTLFHRVIKDFMIQAGDPNSRNASPQMRLGTGGPGYNIPAEIHFPELYHKRGALAAARQGDQVNPERQSSGSQFYIVVGKVYTDAELDMIEQRLTMMLRMREPFKFTPKQRDDYKSVGGTPFLDGQYTVFGEVVSGFDVIDKIANAETRAGDRPVEDIKILGVKVSK